MFLFAYLALGRRFLNINVTHFLLSILNSNLNFLFKEILAVVLFETHVNGSKKSKSKLKEIIIFQSKTRALFLYIYLYNYSMYAYMCMCL